MASRGERIEWGLGVVCGLVVLALAGYLAWEGLSDGATRPRLSVETMPGEAGEVRVTVRNEGGRAATAVAVALRTGEGERRLVIDYVPGHSEVSGGFLLPGGASPEAVEVVVEGYVDP